MKSNNSLASRRLPTPENRREAEKKLCRFFASYGIDAMMARERLIDPFIERAAQFWRSRSGFDLASLALEEAEFDLGVWFAGLLGMEENGGRATLVSGRAAFLMCRGPKRFAHLFLLPIEDLPSDFVETMREHVPSAVPPSDDGDMHHQPYEAWSVRNVFAMAAPLERSMMQLLGGAVRRDSHGRVLGVNWRNTGPTS